MRVNKNAIKEIQIVKDGDDFAIQVVYGLTDENDQPIPNTEKRSSVKITEATQKAKLTAVLNLLKPIFKQQENL